MYTLNLLMVGWRQIKTLLSACVCVRRVHVLLCTYQRFVFSSVKAYDLINVDMFFFSSSGDTPGTSL